MSNYDIDKNYLRKVVMALLSQPDYFNDEIVKNSSKTIAESFYNDTEIVKTIVENKKLTPLISPEIIINIISQINNKNDELINKETTLQFIDDIPVSRYTEKTIEPIFNKVIEILTFESNQPYDTREAIKEEKAKFCYQLLSKIIIGSNNRERIPLTALNQILDVIINIYANINWNQKYFLLPILYQLKEIADEDFNLKINQNILSFVSSSDIIGFERFYKFNKSYEVLTTTEDIKNNLLKRAVSNKELLDIIYSNSESIQIDILLRILTSNQPLFIQFLKEKDYKVKDKVEIANNIVEETKKNIAPQLKHDLYVIIDTINPSKEGFEFEEFITQLKNNYLSQNVELQRQTTLYLNETKFITIEDKQNIILASLSTFISNPQANFSIITNIINEINFEIKGGVDDFYNTYKDVYDKFFFEQRNLAFIKLFIKRVSYSCKVEIIKTLFKNIEKHISININSDLRFSPFLNEMLELIDQNIFKEIKGELNNLIAHYLEVGRNPEVLKTGIKYIEKYKSLNKSRIPKGFKEKLQDLYHRKIDVNTIELLKPHINNSSIQVNLHNQPIEVGKYDDDIYNGEIFDLRKYSYQFTIKLKSIIPYWRLGFVFSPNGNFNQKTQRTVANFPLIHLTKNNNEDKLAFTLYSNGVNNNIQEVIKDNYKKQEIIIEVKMSGNNAVISFLDKSMNSLHSDIVITNYYYFKLFAWADAKNDFDIDVIIDKQVV